MRFPTFCMSTAHRQPKLADVFGTTKDGVFMAFCNSCAIQYPSLEFRKYNPTQEEKAFWGLILSLNSTSPRTIIDDAIYRALWDYYNLAGESFSLQAAISTLEGLSRASDLARRRFQERLDALPATTK